MTTRKQTPPLLTAGQFKELLDDVFPNCIVHISSSGDTLHIGGRKCWSGARKWRGG